MSRRTFSTETKCRIIPDIVTVGTISPIHTETNTAQRYDMVKNPPACAQDTLV